MSSTNKTTHYNLSQYTASDKPSYLVDYNSDMSNIDTGIYNAQSETTANTTAIGTLANLTTTEKNNLVGAINEVDGNVDTISGTVSDHTIDIAANTSAIGNLANLTTTDKSNLVNAVNEVRTEVYKQKRVNLASGPFTSQSESNIITLSEDFRNYDDIIVGGSLFTYIEGQQVLATDKIVLNREYCLYAARTSNLYLSISYIFNSYTEIEIIRDESSWAGNLGQIDFVEGQHL